uniref:F-box domain-containing protein n=1 Tax=Steinernema glaseri TaxID=37863 RepID=A0A1I8AHY6_9BILA
MDTVPRLFMESVCLCLLDRPSLRESTKIPSVWGKICTATSKKIHTLRVVLDGSAEKIYAAAEPVRAYNTNAVFFSDLPLAVPLDSVDPKYITNFRIETNTRFIVPSSTWKEITLDNLQRLVHFIRPRVVHFIRPVRNERPPLRYFESINTLILYRQSNWINGKLLAMQLPCDVVIQDPIV